LYNGHLSIEQIESLSQQESQSSRQQNTDDWSHVESCDHCRSLVEKCRIVDARLGQLASAQLRQESNMNCPDQKTWFEVAAGALPDEKSLQYLEHAATCDSCGAKLKTAVRTIDAALTSDDELLLDKLSNKIEPTQVPLKERKLPPDDKKPLLFFQFWKPIAYAVTALSVFGIIGWGSLSVYQAHESRVAKELLAAEYSKWRPTEYRLADLPYGPPRSQLGAAQKRYIHISGHDPSYRAAAALLKLDSFSAIAILENARNSGDTSKSVLEDLVVAYAVEYGKTGSDQYLRSALQLANEIIEKYPNDSVGYFNRALIYTNRNCPDCAQKARADFEQVVRLEHDSNWVREVQNRLH